MSILSFLGRKAKKPNNKRRNQNIFEQRAIQMGWDKKPLYKGPRTEKGKYWLNGDGK